MSKQKRRKVYAFIDSQNLNLGTGKDLFKDGERIYKGWPLDFHKFRVYLSDKFRVNKAFLFIGYVPEHQRLYSYLKRCGYDLVFKPTVKDDKGKTKGNVDAELVLHSAAIEFARYDKAVVVAGDGDYRCLCEFLNKRGKLLRIVIPNSKSESTLLTPFQAFKTFIENEKAKLEEKKP